MNFDFDSLIGLAIPAIMLAVFLPFIWSLSAKPSDTRTAKLLRASWMIFFSAYALGSLYFQSLLLRTGSHEPTDLRPSPIEIKGMTLYVTPGQADFYGTTSWLHIVAVSCVFVAIYLSRRSNDA